MQVTSSVMEASQAATVPVVSHKKRLIPTALKFLISSALIWWIIRGTDLSEIFNAVEFANKKLLLLAFSLHFIGYYIAAHRWRVLLKVQDIDTSIPFLIKSYMVAIFFNNFLPSTIGGDAVRAYDSWRVGESKVGAVALIVVDRLLGVLALMLFAAGALVISKDLTKNLPFLYLWVPLGVLGVLVLTWMIFLPSKHVSRQIKKIRLPFLAKLSRILEKFISAFTAFDGCRNALVKGLGLSMILQLNVILHYYLIGMALHFPVALHNFFLIIPLAIFIMMIPVSVNAIGIRENLFVLFFATLGVSKPEALAFAWLAYGMVLLQGLVGGLVYALRK